MSDATSDQDTLRKVLGESRAVLFDFDGPVTDLFGGVSTESIADEIKEEVQRLWGPLDPPVKSCKDSHHILQRVRDMFDRPSPHPRDPEALVRAETIVTGHEYHAAREAIPVPGLGPLLDALLAKDRRLVIVSNNAAGPVREFLKSHGLESEFEAVHGRDPNEIRHMKPHPDSVDRALRQLGLSKSPREGVMIGDQPTDLTAALKAGAGFIGLTTSPERATEMRQGGADAVVRSHDALIDVVKSLRTPN